MKKMILGVFVSLIFSNLSYAQELSLDDELKANFQTTYDKSEECKAASPLINKSNQFKDGENKNKTYTVEILPLDQLVRYSTYYDSNSQNIVTTVDFPTATIARVLNNDTDDSKDCNKEPDQCREVAKSIINDIEDKMEPSIEAHFKANPTLHETYTNQKNLLACMDQLVRIFNTTVKQHKK